MTDDLSYILASERDRSVDYDPERGQQYVDETTAPALDTKVFKQPYHTDKWLEDKQRPEEETFDSGGTRNLQLWTDLHLNKGENYGLERSVTGDIKETPEAEGTEKPEVQAVQPGALSVNNQEVPQNNAQTPVEIYYPTVESIYIAHEEAIIAKGGEYGEYDYTEGMVEAAIGRMQMGTYDREFYPSVIEKAAVLMHSLAYHHTFLDGNKRTSFEVTVAFLEANWFSLNEADEITDIIFSASKGQAEYEDILPLVRKYAIERGREEQQEKLSYQIEEELPNQSWVVVVYDNDENEIDCWYLDNRTEEEAEREALAEVERTPNAADWSLMPYNRFGIASLAYKTEPEWQEGAPVEGDLKVEDTVEVEMDYIGFPRYTFVLEAFRVMSNSTSAYIGYPFYLWEGTYWRRSETGKGGFFINHIRRYRLVDLDSLNIIASKEFDNEIFVYFELPQSVEKHFGHIKDLEDELHMTLYYAKDTTPSDEQKKEILNNISQIAKNYRKIKCKFTGLGTMDNGDNTVAALVNLKEGAQLHTELTNAIQQVYKEQVPEFGYLPHVSLKYETDGKTDIKQLKPFAWTQTTIGVKFSDNEKYTIELKSGKISGHQNEVNVETESKVTPNTSVDPKSDELTLKFAWNWIKGKLIKTAAPETYTDASDIDMKKDEFDNRANEFEQGVALDMDKDRNWYWGETDYTNLPRPGLHQTFDGAKGYADVARASLKFSYKIEPEWFPGSEFKDKVKVGDVIKFQEYDYEKTTFSTTKVTRFYGLSVGGFQGDPWFFKVKGGSPLKYSNGGWSIRHVKRFQFSEFPEIYRETSLKFSEIDLPDGESYSDYYSDTDFQPDEAVQHSPTVRKEKEDIVKYRYDTGDEEKFFEKGLHQNFDRKELGRPVTPFGSLKFSYITKPELKVGDTVRIKSKSIGRDFLSLKHRTTRIQDIRTSNEILRPHQINIDEDVYVCDQDFFLERDLELVPLTEASLKFSYKIEPHKFQVGDRVRILSKNAGGEYPSIDYGKAIGIINGVTEGSGGVVDVVDVESITQDVFLDPEECGGYFLPSDLEFIGSSVEGSLKFSYRKVYDPEERDFYEDEGETFTIDQIPEDSDLYKKILENYHDINTEDSSYWSEYTIEGWKEKLGGLGYDDDVKMHWSGFWSQGDGASFESFIDVQKFLVAHRIQRSYPHLWYYVNKLGGYCSCRITQNDNRYVHSNTMSSNVEVEPHNYEDELKKRFRGEDAVGKVEEEASQFEEDVLDISRNYADEIYRDLEKSYDAESSEEMVIETLRINDYEFDMRGKISSLDELDLLKKVSYKIEPEYLNWDQFREVAKPGQKWHIKCDWGENYKFRHNEYDAVILEVSDSKVSLGDHSETSPEIYNCGPKGDIGRQFFVSATLLEDVKESSLVVDSYRTSPVVKLKELIQGKRKDKTTKKIGYNTYAVVRDNAVAIKYNQTDIVTFGENSVILQADGWWYSMTTRARMNKWLHWAGIEGSVISDRNKRYYIKGHDWDTRYPIDESQDSFEIDYSGNPVGAIEPVIRKRRVRREVEEPTNIPEQLELLPEEGETPIPPVEGRMIFSYRTSFQVGDRVKITDTSRYGEGNFLLKRAVENSIFEIESSLGSATNPMYLLKCVDNPSDEWDVDMHIAGWIFDESKLIRV